MRDTHSPRLAGTPPLSGRIAAQVALAAAGGVATIAAAGTVLAGNGPGLLAAVLAFLLVCAGMARAMRRGYPHGRIGGCNVVTLLRAALACALLMPLAAGDAAGWAVAGMAGVALALDGMDGHLARRSGLASRFGARFDMETDAALALVLSLHVVAGTAVGAEGLALGLPRYGFLLAGAVLPWLRADLPERRWRKAVCVVQVAALILLQVPWLSPGQAVAVARLAALLVIASFAVDIRWLWARRG